MGNIENSKKTEKSKIWIFFSSVFKSLLVFIIVGAIMFGLSLIGSKIYRKESTNLGSVFLGYTAILSPLFGILGIIFYIAINTIGFLLYNHIIKKFKDYRPIVGKCLFVILSIAVNFMMLIAYFDLFGDYYFKNKILENTNWVFIRFGAVTFPITFIIAYLIMNKHERKVD